MKVVFYLISLLILLACERKNNNSTRNQLVLKNAFDTILGDKMMNEKTGEMRVNNFQSITKIPVANVYQKSTIYDIKKINERLFLLQQKKKYKDARSYNIIIAIENEKIVGYYIINDSKIVDFECIENELLLLCSNFQSTSKYWKSENEIKMLQLNSNLEEKWKYAVKEKSFRLDASELKLENGKTKILAHVITGCDICYNSVELVINANGKCKSAKEVSKLNSSISIDQKKLDSMFVYKF